MWHNENESSVLHMLHTRYIFWMLMMIVVGRYKLTMKQNRASKYPSILSVFSGWGAFLPRALQVSLELVQGVQPYVGRRVHLRHDVANLPEPLNLLIQADDQLFPIPLALQVFLLPVLSQLHLPLLQQGQDLLPRPYEEEMVGVKQSRAGFRNYIGQTVFSLKNKISKTTTKNILGLLILSIYVVKHWSGLHFPEYFGLAKMEKNIVAKNLSVLPWPFQPGPRFSGTAPSCFPRFLSPRTANTSSLTWAPWAAWGGGIRCFCTSHSGQPSS